MATAIPKNVAAAIGLVPTVLGGARRLPAKAVQLPVIAVGSALAGVEAAKREYGDLAERGEKLIARLRGTSLDEVEEVVQEVGKVAARAATNLNNGATTNAKQAVKDDASKARDRAAANQAVQQTLDGTDTADTAKTADAGEPKDAAPTRVDSAASADVIEQVDKIAGNMAAPLITDPSELPLADYDHLTLGSLRSRMRSLDLQQLVQLRDYEKSKADRLPVVTMLDHRIAKLANGESTPTGSQDESSSTAPAASRPPKSVGQTAAAKASNSPPRTKVRIT